MSNSNRIEIPLVFGMKLVAEANEDPEFAQEIYVGIEDKDGVWIQDLAVIQKSYHFKPDGQIDWSDDLFNVLVYADQNREDYTHKHIIPLWRET